MDSISNYFFQNSFDALPQTSISAWKEVKESKAETRTELTLDWALSKAKSNVSEQSPFRLFEIVGLFHQQLELADLKSVMAVSKLQLLFAKLSVIIRLNNDTLTPRKLGIYCSYQLENYFPKLLRGKLTKIDCSNFHWHTTLFFKQFEAVNSLVIPFWIESSSNDIKNITHLSFSKCENIFEELEKYLKRANQFRNIKHLTLHSISPKYKDSISVSGHFLNGSFCEKPVYIASGNKWEGIIEKVIDDYGQQILTIPNTSEGKLTYASGVVFTGKFLKLNPHEGTQVMKSGTIYIGTFQDNGDPLKGILTMSSGRQYEIHQIGLVAQ